MERKFTIVSYVFERNIIRKDIRMFVFSFLLVHKHNRYMFMRDGLLERT